MGVVSVVEIADSDSGKKSIADGVMYERAWRITMASPTDRPSIIWAHASIPDLYDAYPGDSTAILKELSADREKGTRLIWIVKGGYGKADDTEPPGSGQDPEDPTRLPPDIEGTSQVYQRPVYRAYQTGDTRDAPTKAVINSAGMPFADAAVYDHHCDTIVITRNEDPTTFDEDLYSELKGTCNSSSITIAGITIPEYCGKMADISWRRLWDTRGQKYFQVTYKIEVDYEDHRSQILNQGYYYLSGGGTTHAPVLDENGNPCHQQKLLKVDGTQAAIGDDPTFARYYIYWKASWSSLGLPSSP